MSLAFNEEPRKGSRSGLRHRYDEKYHPSKVYKYGPKSKYKPIEIIQALADGVSLSRYTQQIGGNISGLNEFLLRLRRRTGVNTNTQLVAHFLRNGWID